MPDDETQGVKDGAPTPGGASPGARFLVGLALVACWVTFLAPVSATLALLIAGGLVAVAAVVQLHTGGFALEPFTICAWLGLGCAALMIVGSWLRRAGAPEAETIHPFKRWAASLLALCSLVTFGEWDGNAWLPDPLSSFLVLSSLFALVVAVPLAVFWGGVRLAMALYRWSRASAFVAGMVTALAGLLALGSGATCNEMVDDPPPRAEETEQVRTAKRVLRTAIEADGFTESMRALLMAAAKAIDPEVFARIAGPAERPRALGPASPPPPSPLPWILPPSPSADPEAHACLEDLAGGGRIDIKSAFEPFFSRVRGNHPFLSEEDLKDLIVDTMLEVCLAHDRATFASPRAIFLNKLDLRAIDRSRKARRDCELLSEFAACQLGQVDTMRDPELDALHDMLCGLKQDERLILLLRIVIGSPFAEIGDALKISADKAREIFHNTRRRLKKQLEARCSASPWDEF